MRNGVEEKKEWRRWRSLFFDQNLGCIFMVVPSSSSDLLPCPFDNSDYGTLDEALLLFKKLDFLTT
jgi:hypothetical protein